MTVRYFWKTNLIFFSHAKKHKNVVICAKSPKLDVVEQADEQWNYAASPAGYFMRFGEKAAHFLSCFFFQT